MFIDPLIDRPIIEFPVLGVVIPIFTFKSFLLLLIQKIDEHNSRNESRSKHLEGTAPAPYSGIKKEALAASVRTRLAIKKEKRAYVRSEKGETKKGSLNHLVEN